MLILNRFRWYRRARGGYWAQVTSLMFNKPYWCRVGVQPMPEADEHWEFYPWASRTHGNGYVDEWHAVEPMYLVPLSSITNELVLALESVSRLDCLQEHNSIESQVKAVLEKAKGFK